MYQRTCNEGRPSFHFFLFPSKKYLCQEWSSIQGRTDERYKNRIIILYEEIDIHCVEYCSSIKNVNDNPAEVLNPVPQYSFLIISRSFVWIFTSRLTCPRTESRSSSTVRCDVTQRLLLLLSFVYFAFISAFRLSRRSWVRHWNIIRVDKNETMSLSAVLIIRLYMLNLNAPNFRVSSQLEKIKKWK